MVQDVKDNSSLVSIIMPAYRCQDTLLKAVTSVIEQTYQDWELIIINDCCPDSSYSVISHIQDKRVSILHNKINSGVAVTRNKGIELAKGKYIAFLDSDDYWLSEKLAMQVRILEKGFDIVCSSYYRDKLGKHSLVEAPKFIQYQDMLKSNLIGNLTGVYNQKKLGKVFQKNIGHEDYVMWLELCQKANRIVGLQQPLAVYHVSDVSVSSNKLQAASWQWNIYRKELNLSLVQAIYHFCHYAYHGLTKQLS